AGSERRTVPTSSARSLSIRARRPSFAQHRAWSRIGGRKRDSTSEPASASPSMRADVPVRFGKRGSARNGSVAVARGQRIAGASERISKRETAATEAARRPAPTPAGSNREVRETAGAEDQEERGRRKATAGGRGRREVR